MIKQKKIAILGSTGSVGQQVLDVINENPGLYKVSALTAHNNAELLIKQAIQHKPEAVIITNEKYYHVVKEALSPHTDIAVHTGFDSLVHVSEIADFELFFNALLGLSALEPALHAIANGKSIALANKECMVAGGNLVMEAAKKHGTTIIPVDSEHSAIFQCLRGEDMASIEKIYLTASGGPFRTMPKPLLYHVTAKEALKHPNWNMGKKISIDSATLINKGMEAIAAKWLFGLTSSQICYVLHPQSVVHSMVQFCDGSIKTQWSIPDMKLPIHYALAYPQRIHSAYERLDFEKRQILDFESINVKDHPCLELADFALKKGGNLPCCMSAANDMAVDAFLKEKVGFMHIPEIIESCMGACTLNPEPSLEEILETDTAARITAQEAIARILTKSH